MYRQSEKNLLSSNISSTCPYNTVNFGPLAAEIVSLVWSTPANFNGFRVLAALLHNQTARWTEGATCIRQGGHHVGHWLTFLVLVYFNYRTQVRFCFSAVCDIFCLFFILDTTQISRERLSGFAPNLQVRGVWPWLRGVWMSRSKVKGQRSKVKVTRDKRQKNCWVIPTDNAL